MNRMNIFNLFYKVKKAKFVESGAVDRIKLAYILI